MNNEQLTISDTVGRYNKKDKDNTSQFSIFNFQFERNIDCHGNLLMPGLKNCHAHSAMALLRGAGEGLPLKRWLFERIFPLEAKLTPEDVYWATHSAIAEYLAAGVTAVQDMYFFTDETARAVNEAGYCMVGVGSSSDLDGKTEESLLKQEAFLKKYPSGGFSFRAGFHAEYTASGALLKGVKLLSDKFGSPVHFHLSETADEVQACFEKTGMTPPERIASFGLFERGGAAYHCVHLTDNDLRYFGNNAQSNRYQVSGNRYQVKDKDNTSQFSIFNSQFRIVSCPRSNLKLGSGVAPLKKYLSNGISIALGTDGAASNNRLSMFDEINAAALLANAQCTMHNAQLKVSGNRYQVSGKGQPVIARSRGDEGQNKKDKTKNCQLSIVNCQLSVDEALDMALYSGAYAMGMPDTSELKDGMRADIILVDINKPNMRPRENLAANLVYSASDSNVLMTMVGGKILYENGEYKTGVDYERVGREFDKAAKRLYK